MNFTSVNPCDIATNVFSDIGKRTMLIGACDKQSEKSIGYNAMTASWGAMGVLWGKNVFWCYIRPQRYTMEFIGKTDIATLSFFDEKDENIRKALKICGTKSGRDGDKLHEAGLTPFVSDAGELMFSEAQMTIVGKKLYCGKIAPENFVETALDAKNYPTKDYHFEICYEIMDVRINNKV